MVSLDLQPTLIGSTITLRPLRTDDFEELFKSASDPNIWVQHPDSARYKRDVFERNFFAGAIASGGAFVVVDNASQKIIGSTRFYEWNSKSREITIGYTFLEQKYWGIGTNSEMKKLMLDYAFEKARAVWFHVGKINLRSRRAVEKLGAKLEYEEVKESNGDSYTQLYYRLEAPK